MKDLIQELNGKELKEFGKDIEKSFIQSFINLIKNTGGDFERNMKPEMLPHIEMLLNIISGLEHLERKHGYEPHEMSWTDEIADELRSAEEKYAEYQKTRDTTMLEMARDEAKHANFYINRAKMSPDMKLREKVPEYEKRYAEIAKMVNAPHGSEKLPRL